MQSTLARFDALGDRPAEASEMHYTQVHVPLAIELLGSVPAIVQYSTYVVRRQYDAVGRWNKRLGAWRFASQMILTPDEIEDGSAATAFPEDVRQRLAQDHRNCLRHLRRFDVEDVVLVSHGSAHALQRYFFEFERDDRLEADVARARFDAACEAVGRLALHAQGSRFVVRRGVRSEAETARLDDEGQLLTGRSLASSTMVGYLEVVFDSHYWAEPFFARNDVRDALRVAGFASIEGFEVAEVVGFDKRR